MDRGIGSHRCVVEDEDILFKRIRQPLHFDLRSALARNADLWGHSSRVRERNQKISCCRVLLALIRKPQKGTNKDGSAALERIRDNSRLSSTKRPSTEAPGRGWRYSSN